MLPKSERLTKSSEFSTIYNRKRSVANSLLVLYAGKINRNGDPTRAAFVVGKKVSKRSTKRNRVKRLMREAYKLAKTEHPETCTSWESFIFIARPGILEQNFKEVYHAVMDNLNRLKNRFSRD